MRVTEKGQVTIPKPIRDRLKISPGSEVDFIERDDGVVELVRGARVGVRSAELTDELNRWFRRIEGTGDSGLSSDDIMAMTRGHDGRDDR